MGAPGRDGRGRRRAPGGGVSILLLGLAGAFAASPAVGADAGPDSGIGAAQARGWARAREARGWLQLEQDRRDGTAVPTPGGSAPLAPAQSLAPQARERQARIRRADTYQDQRREIEDRVRAQRYGSRPAQGARTRGLLMRQDREVEGLRLREGIERRGQGIGAPRPPRPPRP